jgi:hypothetical protein
VKPILRRPAMGVVALMLGAGVLRFATLNVQSIWLDESATMVLVRRGFSGMLSHLSSSESAPPLYYILVWAWTKLFGTGPAGFRSFSAFVGVLTIPVVYAAGREISARVGLWAAALAAVNPAMYYYSQEARAYALAILFSAAALVFWQRAMRAPERRDLWLWAAMSILAVLTHYFAAFLFIAEALLLARRAGWRRVLPSASTVALVGIALIPLALREREDGKSNWIEAASLASRVAESAKQFLVGLYGPVEILSALLAALLVAAALARLRYANRRERDAARDLAIIAAVAIGIPLLFAVSHLLDVFDGRNMIAVWTPCAVIVAIGLGVGRAPRVGAALGAGLCAVSLAVVIATNAIPGYQRDDWRGAARALPPGTADRVIVGPRNSALPLSIYLPSTSEARGASVATRELDFVALRRRRTGRAPAPPVVPTSPPPGFRLAWVHRSESHAASRFLSPQATSISLAALRRMSGDREAEVIVQR